MKLTPQDTSPPVALLEHVGQQFGATIALRGSRHGVWLA